jgi:hypothetical protein
MDQDLNEDPGSPAFMDAQEDPEFAGNQEEAAPDGVAGAGCLEAGKDVQESASKQKRTEVFIGGLAREAGAEDLICRFGEVGDIAEVRLRVDPEGMVANIVQIIPFLCLLLKLFLAFLEFMCKLKLCALAECLYLIT